MLLPESVWKQRYAKQLRVKSEVDRRSAMDMADEAYIHRQEFLFTPEQEANQVTSYWEF